MSAPVWRCEDLGAEALWLRELVHSDLSFHATSNAHPKACLCGQWDGSETFQLHLADAIVADTLAAYLDE